MKSVVAASLVVLASAGDWEDYKQKFQKSFANPAEEARRKAIFEESVKRIDELNQLNGEAVFGLTRESDRLDGEKHATGYRPSTQKRQAEVRLANKATAPSVVDWRGTVAVTPVKNQGQCGSCWAFSVAETVESSFNLAAEASGDALELSPQQINSCSTANYGCNGGNPGPAYEYIESVIGLSNSFYWPYQQSMTEQGYTKVCPATKLNVFSGPDASLAGAYATVTGWNYVIPECSTGACDSQDMAGLAAAVAEGPVSICLNAGVWNDYTGGVLTDAACGSHAADALDHCVQLVGYNANASSPYWIVRNSWSTTWGQDGYIYLEYPANTCGLGNEATKPVIGNAPTKTVVV
jgi:hypothetical protein